MSNVIINTEQFVLTKITRNDLDKYYQMCINPNVMKFVTGYPLSKSESDAMLYEFTPKGLENSYLGRYFIELKSNGMLIGLAKLDEFEHQAEIGYRILEEFWGLGYATNLVKALMEFANKTLKFDMSVAFVDIENKASIRVLEKAGMINVDKIQDIDLVKYKFVYYH